MSRKVRKYTHIYIYLRFVHTYPSRILSISSTEVRSPVRWAWCTALQVPQLRWWERFTWIARGRCASGRHTGLGDATKRVCRIFSSFQWPEMAGLHNFWTDEYVSEVLRPGGCHRDLCRDPRPIGQFSCRCCDGGHDLGEPRSISQNAPPPPILLYESRSNPKILTQSFNTSHETIPFMIPGRSW